MLVEYLMVLHGLHSLSCFIHFLYMILKMKPNLLFTFSLLYLSVITSCNNQSDQLKTDAVTETNNIIMDKEKQTNFGKNILKLGLVRKQKVLPHSLHPM